MVPVLTHRTVLEMGECRGVYWGPARPSRVSPYKHRSTWTRSGLVRRRVDGDTREGRA